MLKLTSLLHVYRISISFESSLHAHTASCCMTQFCTQLVLVTAGTTAVRRSKVVGPMKRNRCAAGFVWRNCFDEQSCQVVTDRPVTDFLDKR